METFAFSKFLTCKRPLFQVVLHGAFNYQQCLIFLALDDIFHSPPFLFGE